MSEPFTEFYAVSRETPSGIEWYSFLDNIFFSFRHTHCLTGSLVLASEAQNRLESRGMAVIFWVFTLVPGEVYDDEHQARVIAAMNAPRVQADARGVYRAVETGGDPNGSVDIGD